MCVPKKSAWMQAIPPIPCQLPGAACNSSLILPCSTCCKWERAHTQMHQSPLLHCHLGPRTTCCQSFFFFRFFIDGHDSVPRMNPAISLMHTSISFSWIPDATARLHPMRSSYATTTKILIQVLKGKRCAKNYQNRPSLFFLLYISDPSRQLVRSCSLHLSNLV
jgi:hypothetical protein